MDCIVVISWNRGTNRSTTRYFYVLIGSLLGVERRLLDAWAALLAMVSFSVCGGVHAFMDQLGIVIGDVAKIARFLLGEGSLILAAKWHMIGDW